MRLFIIACAWLAATSVRAEVHGSPVAEFPFQYRDGLIWVSVTTDRALRPLNFLLDSGAAASALDERTARELGLRLGRPVIVRGVEAEVMGRWTSGLGARLGDKPLAEKLVAVDLAKFSAACGQHADGLLGADFFQGRVIELDFAALKIRLLESVSVSAGSEVLPLRIRRGAMCVPVTVNGKTRQWVRLDTGCASALHWVVPGPAPAGCPCEPATGLSNMSLPRTQTTVQFGGEKFQAVPTGLHQHEIFAGESGLLGNPLLSKFNVTIDADAGRLILAKR